MSLPRDAMYNPRSSYREQCQVDATQMCRICAEISDGLVSVFSKDGAKMDLINKIHTHLPIEVTMYDDLPLACCNHCIGKLNACHELVNRCLEADWKLRSLLHGDKHLPEYSRGDQNGIEELDRRGSLRSTREIARNAIARIDDHSMHTSKTYSKRIVKGLKRKSPLGMLDTLQEGEFPNMSEAQDKHISYSAHLPEVDKKHLPKTYMVKRQCSESTLPDKEKLIQALPIKQKFQQKGTHKYKVVLVKLKNSASLSKAVQVEEALKIVKTKQEAGALPEAKGPIPKRLQRKLQGLRTYGLLKPNKYIRLSLEPRDFQTEDTSNMLTASRRNTDHFNCPSCEKMFMSIGALNSHVASSHKDILFCYCSQTFKTQTQLNEHLELHVSEEIESEALNRVSEEIESEALNRVSEEIESEGSKFYVSEEIECEPSKSRVSEEIGREALKSHVLEKIASKASKPRVKEEIESELIECHVKNEVSEPSKSSPTEIGDLLISQIVPSESEQTPRVWLKNLDTLPSSLIRENVDNDLAKSVAIIRASPLTKGTISHDQRENATKLVSDSCRSLNTGESGNDPSIGFESGTLVDRTCIGLAVTEGNNSGIDIKCESQITFSSLGESRDLVDSIIASIPKTKTKIWRCPMCGLVYPGVYRWLKHCEGINFRCHFCKVVLRSELEQKQHETEHLKSNHILQ